jgi:hypothetical protein
MVEAAILIGLAGWRVASLLVTEDGPFKIFERIRWHFQPVGIISDHDFFDSLFNCIWCMSIWTTALMAVIWLFCPEAVIVIAAMSIALVPELISGHSKHPD